VQEVLLVRYGEIGLKGGNRSSFEEALTRHLRFAVREEPGARVERTHGRVFISGLTAPEKALHRVARIPGVVGVSLARRVDQDMDLMKQHAVEVCRDAASWRSGPRTFKVNARRSDKSFPLASPEINQELGRFVLDKCPELSVDVHEPAFVLNVEVREEGIYLYTDEVPGPGGLPIGTGGKAILLLSGGIDSPVAGYLAMKRGVDVDALHFWSFPLTSERAREKVVKLAQVLREYNPHLRLHIAHFTDIQTAIMEKCPEKLRVTIMRRMMMRVASRLASRIGALAIFTGENIGQVASQTLESLAAIQDASTVPVIRPLACFNKVETIDLAKHIGTYDLSVLPYEDCCTVFVPKHPVIKPKLSEVLKAESALDIDALLDDCISRLEECRL